MTTQALRLSEGELIRLEYISENVHYCINTRFMALEDGLSLIVSCSQKDVDLKVGDEMTARVVGSGKLTSFPTKILGRKDDGQLYLHYPLAQTPKLPRSGERVSVQPRTIRLTMSDGGKQIKVELADLSLAGARLVSPARLGNIDDRFMIDMQIPHSGEIVTLPCMIRYVRSDLPMKEEGGEAMHHHGVSFDELSDTARHFIENFVDSRLNIRQPMPL